MIKKFYHIFSTFLFVYNDRPFISIDHLLKKRTALSKIELRFASRTPTGSPFIITVISCNLGAYKEKEEKGLQFMALNN